MALKRKCTIFKKKKQNQKLLEYSSACHSPVLDFEWSLTAQAQGTLHNLESTYFHKLLSPHPPHQSSLIATAPPHTQLFQA